MGTPTACGCPSQAPPYPGPRHPSLQSPSCEEPIYSLQLPLSIWPRGEPGFRRPSPACELELPPQHPQTSRSRLQVAAFSFLSLHRPLFPKCSHLVLAPPPYLSAGSCCPYAPSLYHACAPRCPQEDAGPRAGVAPWERFVSKTGTRAGGWAGRPFPTAVRFLPLPASSAQHQAGRGAQGHLRWGERGAPPRPAQPNLGSPTLGASSGAAPRPRPWPPGCVAGEWLSCRRDRRVRGEREPQWGRRSQQCGAPRRAGRGGGGRGAGAGRQGAGLRRGERAGAAAAARPAGGSARRWRRPCRVRAP